MTGDGETPGSSLGSSLDRLWAPYRMDYIHERRDGVDDECPFCAMVTVDQQAELMVTREERVFVVLNLFPYNPGHLMVVPTRHVADLTELSDAEAADVARLTQHALRAIRRVSAPEAFNVGYNLGSAAGGSVAAHLHQHVVPRWSGDANLMTVLGGTRTMPQLLETTADLLRDAWDEEG